MCAELVCGTIILQNVLPFTTDEYGIIPTKLEIIEII